MPDKKLKPAKRTPASKANAMKTSLAAAFEARLRNTLGERHKEAFAEASGVAISTVYRWCSGDVPVPTYAIVIVEFLEALPKGFRPERWVKE